LRRVRPIFVISYDCSLKASAS